MNCVIPKEVVAIVDAGLGVVAQCVAIWFLQAYSKVSYVRHNLADNVYLAGVHRLLLERWWLLLIVPLVSAVIILVAARARSKNSIRLIPSVSWLFALTLVCFALVAWEDAFIPIIRFGD